MAAFILAIACINYMNLSTARSTKRAREVGIRQVVGANRLQLIRQFFGESVLLSFIAVFIAGIFVESLLPTFNNLCGKQLVMDYSIQNVLVLIALAIITGIISGSYPAFVLSSLKPVSVLKGSLKWRSGGSWFRRGLVIVQFALSIFLIVSALVVYKQISFIRHRDLGYVSENVIGFSMGGELYHKYQTFKTELAANKNIIGITRASTPPVWRESSAAGRDVIWEGKTADHTFPSIQVMGVDTDYLKTFGLRTVAGRFFSEELDREEEVSFILNESAVKAMGIESPVGKRFSIWDYNGTIVGIVNDFHFSSLHNEIQPLAMIQGWGFDNIFIRMKSDNIPETIGFIERKLNEIIPGYTLEFRFLDDMIENLYRTEKRTGSIIKYITILAIFISCLGLFGLASFTAEQRTKEIGIRKVLGSSVLGIIMMLSKEFARWVIIANVIAWPVAWYVSSNWLQNFAYRTSIGPQIYLISGLLALVIALITVSFQAFKAARVNPVESLRYE